MSKPNVLILYSDQHSARTLGCYGNPEVQTPNLDRLAAEGVLFERAYTQNPICTPSRMSFLSGQYPHNFGYYGLMGRTPEALPNIFGHFRRAGYLTGAAGKTHTPAQWLSRDLDYLADGFGYELPKDEKMHHLMEGVQGLIYNEYSQDLAAEGLAEQRDDKIYHEWYDKHGHNAGQGLDARPSQLDEEHSIEAWTAQKTMQFLARAKREERPFVFWMTVPRPHQTYVPAQKFWDLYDENRLTLPPNADDVMSGRHPSARAKQDYFKNDPSWISFQPDDYESARRRVLRAYYANVTQVDDAFGRVIAELERLGLKENTIILYLTDHGEFAGEHGMIEKAPGIAFHCVTHIPSIISWPRNLPFGKRSTALIESVDWLATLSELCELPVPEYSDGQSLLPLIMEDKSVRRYAFTENAFTKTIHSARYKLTQYLPETNGGQPFGELYDLQEDPWELKNLFFEPGRQALVSELQTELLLWLMRTTRVVTVNPSVTTADGKDGDWDIAAEYIAEDRKVKNSFVAALIERGAFNYF